MRLSSVFLFIFVLLFLLTGCNLFDSTYIVESDFPLPERVDTTHDDLISVKSFSELRTALQEAVEAGDSRRTVVFDSGYSGSISEDLASAVWQIRTENALCAYCVENIAYELRQIVSHTEAQLTFTYSTRAVPVSEIHTMLYETSLDKTLSDAISSGMERVAILISRSTLTEESMAAKVKDVYRSNPALAPCEPRCSVTLFSGAGTQKLYDLILESGLDAELFHKEKGELDAVTLTPSAESEDYDKAMQAAAFLTPCCQQGSGTTVYDALVLNSAGPEGISLGYVALCRQLGLDCLLIEGQKDWQDHFWNIVKIDGSYYHVDLFSGTDEGFLKSDEEFWGTYRWNVNDYPKCEHKLFNEAQTDIKSNETDFSESASAEIK